MSRTRCLFVLPSLRGGGAERVTSLLLQHLDTLHFDLHLALVQRTGPYLAALPPHVTLHDLHASRVAHCFVPLVKTIRRVRPDVVFSTISHMNLAVALTRAVWPRGIRLCLRETATCRHIIYNSRWPTWRLGLYRRQYRRADTIICQSPYMYCDLRRHLSLPPERLVVIPNPIDFAAMEQQFPNDCVKLQGEGPHIVSLGGLRRVKGTDRLLVAFPRLLSRRPAAQLWVLGDGPCATSLRQQANRLGIADHVHFIGFQTNPLAWLRAADLFALPSRNESCPNALLEAVACGCPPVTTRHPGGTYEMLAHLGLSHRFAKRLDDWPDEWFEPLPPDTLRLARARYHLQTVVEQYQRVLRSEM